jgi:hypothetical protein
LKERFFGLSGTEGNHGEDVKEYYFYPDATPTHSYMRMLDKYPQSEYPYRDLVDENRKRGVFDFEVERLDTGIFDHRCYFDITVEYAKPGESRAFRLRFASLPIELPFGSFDAVFGERCNEADQFYSAIQRRDIRQEKRMIQRQALVGMPWSKQFYCVTIEQRAAGGSWMIPPVSPLRSING